jgi:hypothetical protein
VFSIREIAEMEVKELAEKIFTFDKKITGKDITKMAKDTI